MLQFSSPEGLPHSADIAGCYTACLSYAVGDLGLDVPPAELDEAIGRPQYRTSTTEVKVRAVDWLLKEGLTVKTAGKGATPLKVIPKVNEWAAMSHDEAVEASREVWGHTTADYMHKLGEAGFRRWVESEQTFQATVGPYEESGQYEHLRLDDTGPDTFGELAETGKVITRRSNGALMKTTHAIVLESARSLPFSDVSDLAEVSYFSPGRIYSSVCKPYVTHWNGLVPPNPGALIISRPPSTELPPA
jgi:hypothetical protein